MVVTGDPAVIVVKEGTVVEFPGKSWFQYVFS